MKTELPPIEWGEGPDPTVVALINANKPRKPDPIAEAEEQGRHELEAA